MSQHGNWVVFKSVPLRLISWEATFWLRKLLTSKQKLLMSKSTIESNGLHYPDSYYIISSEREDVEPSPCYFAGCVPNEPCKVEAWERYHNQPSEVIQEGDDRGDFEADRYEPTNLDDLVY